MYGWITAGATGLILGALLVLASYKIDALKADVNTLEQQKITLVGAVETGKAVNDLTKDILAGNQELMLGFQSASASSDLITQKLRNQINELRITEEMAALNAPFARADAARSRIDSILQRFADPKVKNNLPPDATGADDTGRAEDRANNNP